MQPDHADNEWKETDRLAASEKYSIVDTVSEEAFADIMRLAQQQQRVLKEKDGIEAALRLEKEHHRMATDAAQLGLWSWDPVADLVIFENQRLYEIFDIAPDKEPLNSKRFIYRYIHPDDALAFEKAAATTARTSERFYFQGRIRNAHQKQCWLEFFGSAQHAQDGTLARIIGVVIDITERKQAELALLASRERFQTIVSQAATGVMEADAEGTITFVNRKYCQLLGYTEAELLGKNILDVTAQDSMQVTSDILGQLHANGNASVFEKQYRRKNGSIMWGSASMSLLRSPVGEAHSTISIIVDITENKKAEENLRKLAASLSESNRRKTEFLATLAHEMRNPLAPILSGLNLIQLHGHDISAIAKTRNMIERQVTHLAHLVDDLLDIARVSSGKIVLEKVPVTLKSLITQAIETSQPLIDANNHTLVADLPDESLMLDADPTRITQVLANLLNNAAKYTPSGGHISIGTQVNQDQVLIWVNDTGIGIPQESLMMIFNLFSQVGESINHAQGGLGIGLSLAKRLVEMHDGSIAVTSAGEGAGSTFTVTLPLLHSSMAIPSSAAPEATAPAQNVASLRLLIADDNVDTVETLSMLLAMNGHITEVAFNGIDAVSAIQNFRPDVAFLDIGMPAMNGYEVASAIRGMPSMEGVMLVALTGWGDKNDQIRSKEAGFDHHLTKPVDLVEITTFLAKISTK